MRSTERFDAAFGSKSSDGDFGLCCSEAIFLRCRETGPKVLQMGSNGVENAPMGIVLKGGAIGHLFEAKEDQFEEIYPLFFTKMPKTS